jgi:hypothetical protein
MSDRLDADETAFLKKGLNGLTLAGAERGETKTLLQNGIQIRSHEDTPGYS